jgi:hypothetical protein
MTKLSPAAQAVLDEVLYKMCAGESESYVQMIAAAALQAAVDQVVPHLDEPDWGACNNGHCDIELYADHQRKRAKLLAIAAELNGTNNTSQED